MMKAVPHFEALIKSSPIQYYTEGKSTYMLSLLRLQTIPADMTLNGH